MGLSSVVVRGLEVQIRGDKSVLCCLEGSVPARHDSLSRAIAPKRFYISTFLNATCYKIAFEIVMT